jgi:hypothetical protein
MSHANALPSSIFYVMIDIHIVNCSLYTLIWLITSMHQNLQQNGGRYI